MTAAGFWKKVDTRREEKMLEVKDAQSGSEWRYGVKR